MVLPMTFMTSTKMVDLGAEGEKVHWSIYRDSTLGAFYLPHSLPTKLFVWGSFVLVPNHF